MIGYRVCLHRCQEEVSSYFVRKATVGWLTEKLLYSSEPNSVPETDDAFCRNAQDKTPQLRIQIRKSWGNMPFYEEVL
jgi:hypothetical protein